MSLISIHNLSIAFGGPPLLDAVSMEIHKGQRISVLGRNGVGKTTFMKILAGLISSDSGEIITEPGVRVAYLPQDVPCDANGTIYEVVASNCGEHGTLLTQLYCAQQRSASADEIDLLHHAINEADCWHLHTVINRVLSITQLNGAAQFSTLSGGMRRRVYLARALALEPELLLLDEPTNHLDIPSIDWMESFILSSKLTVLFVTHDRRFSNRLATRIIELDRGKLVDWSCDYPTFLIRKQAVLDAEEKEWERFDKKLAQEEIWIRMGIKARRTRNEGRVRALFRLREERSRRRERSGTVQMEISEASRSGTRLIEARGIGFSYGNNTIVRDCSVALMRGDRVGIIGSNGCGKTTLLNLLLGNYIPDKGTIKTGANVLPLFFDQFRQTLDPEKTVWENVAPGGGDTVFINGSPKHVISYLQDFLFTSDRSKSPVKQLSGGERHRLLLARLFAQESNLLALDEPTNDLDSETLELLEELLSNYKGTIIAVSHDREFLNNVVTSILSFEGKGIVKEYIGGYDDWKRQTDNRLHDENKSTPKPVAKEKPRRETVPATKRTYREEEEFTSLPSRIEHLERELAKLSEKMADPAWYSKDGFIREAKVRCEELNREVAAAYKRWEKLEDKGG
jgi:ATP-binding cassette subfamily F protein uup